MLRMGVLCDSTKSLSYVQPRKELTFHVHESPKRVENDKNLSNKYNFKNSLQITMHTTMGYYSVVHGHIVVTVFPSIYISLCIINNTSRTA